ncbi:hypothetical protein DXG01_017103 [Tephrocybe rancida]|nr:hypothetical protein DXG01_017103 [Tephrocybe rancida]
MGFAFIDKYDVNACAVLCTTRGSDRVGGACQYFNIWRALINGVPTTYTCAFYYIVADAYTAVNYGQVNLKVTYSRGYKRTSLAIDGGFEGYTCDDFCTTESSDSWLGASPAGGLRDASIFHYIPYARTGGSVALLGSSSGVDNLSGTLSPKEPLKTVVGKSYTLGFFANTIYAGPIAEAKAFVNILWNGKKVRTINLGYDNWRFYETTVVATGNDQLTLHGGSGVGVDRRHLHPL